MKDRYMRLSAAVNRAIDCFGGFLFFLMLFFSGFNVFSWWIFGRRYGQLEEIVLACFVWISYITLGQHYKRGECIRVDFLIRLLPGRGQKIVDVLNDICCAAIGSVILWFALKLALKSTNKLTAIIKIPYVLIDLGVVVGMASLLIAIVLKYIPVRQPQAEVKEGAEQ